MEKAKRNELHNIKIKEKLLNTRIMITVYILSLIAVASGTMSIIVNDLILTNSSINTLIFALISFGLGVSIGLLKGLFDKILSMEEMAKDLK